MDNFRKKLTVAVMGLGNRGQNFSGLISKRDDAVVTVIAEPRDYQRNLVGDMFNLPPESRFTDWHQVAAKGVKIADAVMITLQDALHADAAVAFAKLGYDIFLEKPMSPSWADCERIARAAEENHVSLTICHELRYTRYFRKLKELLDSGVIGKVQTLNHFESVVYWHQAHSYVRGNWRNEKLSSFMLLAKSCHDIDIISFLLNKKCVSVSSFGSLAHFRKECAPAGSADRCTKCPTEIESKCPYSACKIYERDRAEKGKTDWPVDIITDNLTPAGIRKALDGGPYGRCVYQCDNDVVDHQVVNMLFEDGITAAFTMSAFTRNGAMRETRIGGTDGEIVGDGETIRVYKYIDDSCQVIETAKNASGNINDGHGGGDGRILDAWIKSLTQADRSGIVTDASATLESHRITFAAEESRKTGRTINL